MKIIRVVFAVFWSVLGLSKPAFSQLAAPEVGLAASIAAAQQQYAAAFAAHPQLYNGPEYFNYAKRYHAQEGHQFFFSPTMQPGSIHYNDHEFGELQLAYDIVLDQVVLAQPYSSLTLRLINEQVRSFTLTNHRFVRLVADSSSRKVIRTGFYEVLLDSTVGVLARREKRMQEHVGRPFINVQFTSTTRLFIRKAGRYYAVASKSSVLHLFPDRSKDLQKYMQEHKLKFNKAQREAAIIELTSYYCSLAAR